MTKIESEQGGVAKCIHYSVQGLSFPVRRWLVGLESFHVFAVRALLQQMLAVWPCL